MMDDGPDDEGVSSHSWSRERDVRKRTRRFISDLSLTPSANLLHCRHPLLKYTQTHTLPIRERKGSMQNYLEEKEYPLNGEPQQHVLYPNSSEAGHVARAGSNE